MWFWTLVPELPPTGFCCRQLIHRFTGTSPVVGFFDGELYDLIKFYICSTLVCRLFQEGDHWTLGLAGVQPAADHLNLWEWWRHYHICQRKDLCVSLFVPSSVSLLHAACFMLLNKAASCRASLLRRAVWSRVRSTWRTVESFSKLNWRWGDCLGCLMRRSWWIITPAATGRAECHDRAGFTFPSTTFAFTPSC